MCLFSEVDASAQRSGNRQGNVDGGRRGSCQRISTETPGESSAPLYCMRMIVRIIGRRPRYLEAPRRRGSIHPSSTTGLRKHCTAGAYPDEQYHGLDIQRQVRIFHTHSGIPEIVCRFSAEEPRSSENTRYISTTLTVALVCTHE